MESFRIETSYFVQNLSSGLRLLRAKVESSDNRKRNDTL